MVVSAPGDLRRFRADIAISPFHEREKDDFQFAALVCQAIFEAIGALGLWLAREDPVIDEAVEPFGEDVRSHAEAFGQLIEAPPAERDIADDEQGPTIAHELKSSGDRAVLTGVVAAEHLRSR